MSATKQNGPLATRSKKAVASMWESAASRLRQGVMLMSLLMSITCSINAETVSWYGEKHRGKITASGEPFDPDKLTCASWDYPFGTPLLVTYGGHAVSVRVSDRGPAKRLGRKLDLSAAAFRLLAPLESGLIEAHIEIYEVQKTPRI